MKRGLPILTFHALEESASPIAFSPASFRRLFTHLHGTGYRTLDLADAVRRLGAGEELAPHALAITFDDGYRSVYTHAFPALADVGMTATIFPVTGVSRVTTAETRLPRLEGRETLSWGEISEMERAGMAFGAHTLTHSDLTQVAPDVLERELGESQAILADALGKAIPCFAYPGGRSDALCRERAAHYFEYAFSDRLGLATAASDRFALERVDAFYFRAEWTWRWLEMESLPWYLRARNVPRRARRAWANAG